MAVLAYGQSGSGKTHTLTGSDNEEGILQLTLEALYNLIGKVFSITSIPYKNSLLTVFQSDRTFVLTISVVEVYNEKIRDLLGFVISFFLLLSNAPSSVLLS